MTKQEIKIDNSIEIQRIEDNDIVFFSMVSGSRKITANLSLEQTENLIEFLQEAVNSSPYHKVLQH